MPDPIFAEPRLAEIYDALDSDRSDLEHYVAMVDEFAASRVLDIGCGTGTLAVMLAERGHDVIAVDPADASLAVAKGKRNAEQVRWLRGDATSLPPLAVDMAVMTANVAQVFVDESDWAATLEGIAAALRPGGRLIFESRDPDRQAWREWTHEHSFARTNVPGVGPVSSWVDLLTVEPGLVSFRWTYEFESDGAVLTSDSTLRFRSKAELAESLAQCGYTVDDVRDAPDRPGREFVFVARRGR